MKVLFTLDFPPERGGIQRYLHDLTVHTFGPCDKVYAGGGPHPRAADARDYPCEVVRLTAPFSSINKKTLLLSMLFRSIGELVRRGPHFTFIAGNIYPGLIAALLSLFVPIRYELYCYGTELLPLRGKRTLRRRLWALSLRRAATVYYLTDATRALCEPSGRRGPYVKAAPRIVLPPLSGIPRPDARNRPLELLAVGRLVPHKGHRVLIEAISGIAAAADWHCTIAGGGPEYERLRALATANNLGEKLSFETDPSDARLAGLYRSTDIFIHPSIATNTGVEGFGIVLLEAMAYGAAIIASRSGGIAEVVDDNPEYAVLVPPGDVTALREAIEALMADAPRRARMTVAARQFCGERHAWN